MHRHTVLTVTGFSEGWVQIRCEECNKEFQVPSYPGHPQAPIHELTGCPFCLYLMEHVKQTAEVLDVVSIHTSEARKKDPNYHDPMGSIRSMAKDVAKAGGLEGEKVLLDVDRAAWDASHPS